MLPHHVYERRNTELKDLAERLPVGATKNGKLSSLTSLSSSPAISDISAAAIEQMGNFIHSHEPDSNGLNGLIATSGASFIGHRNKSSYSETTKNGSKLTDGDSNQECERVEQDEPGVYITLTSLPGGLKDLKRVRFSRKRFSEKQAEQWWAENRARVYEQYNVRIDRSSTTSGGGNDEANR